MSSLDNPKTYPLDPKHPIKTQVAEFFCNLLLSVSLFAIFVAIFFFTVGSTLEGIAVKRNTDRVVQELLEPAVSVLDENEKKSANEQIKYLQAPDMDSEDESVRSKNREIVRNSFLVLGPLLAFGIIVVFGVWKGMRSAKARNPNSAEPFELKTMWIQNGILLAFVALTELLFLGMIGINYRSVKTKDIRLSVINALTDFIK